MSPTAKDKYYRATAVVDTTIAALQQRRITALQHTERTDGISLLRPDTNRPNRAISPVRCAFRQTTFPLYYIYINLQIKMFGYHKITASWVFV